MFNLDKLRPLVLVLLLFSGFSSNSALPETLGKGIDFNRWKIDKALKKAEKQNKPLFVVLYTTSCGVCKKMRRTSFKAEMVGTYFNKHFINILVNANSDEGKSLMASLGLRGVPSLVFISPKAEIQYVTGEYYSDSRLLSLGKRFGE